MSDRNFGLSNIYLKVGLVLVVASVATLVLAAFIPAITGFVSGQVAGTCFLAGVVLYFIGRIVKSKQHGTHA